MGLFFQLLIVLGTVFYGLVKGWEWLSKRFGQVAATLALIVLAELLAAALTVFYYTLPAH